VYSLLPTLAINEFEYYVKVLHVRGMLTVTADAMVLRNFEDIQIQDTDMRSLTTGIRSEKSVGRRFGPCANVYFHKPRLYSLLHT
jgi:hypothetical protein